MMIYIMIEELHLSDYLHGLRLQELSLDPVFGLFR